MGRFFPELAFGWLFCLGLLGWMAVAAVQDLRRGRIPKWLTMPALAAGFAVNMTRAGWVEGGLGGVGDGFLFSLAGFGTGFGLFLAMWVLGTCGGGDVKLFAALGSWVGAKWTVYVLAGTLGLVAVFAALRIGQLVFAGSGVNFTTHRVSDQRRRPALGARRALTTYSLPAALSTAGVLLIVFHRELGLLP